MVKFKNLSNTIKNIIKNREIKKDTKILEVYTQNGQTIKQNLKNDYFREIKENEILEKNFNYYIKNNHNIFCYFIEL